jgi:hypothetical protein
MFILGVYNLSLRVKNNVFLAEYNEVIVHVTIGVSIYSLSQKNRLCVFPISYAVRGHHWT